MTNPNEDGAPAPHELSVEQLDEATGGATEPEKAKPVRETTTVSVLRNTTY